MSEIKKGERRKAPPVPPRRRKKRAGRGQALLTVIVTIVAASVALGIFFRVKNVEVTGNVNSDTVKIKESSGISTGTNLLFLNKLSMIRGIIDENPYVSEVTIRRRLPGTVVIQVTESVALCYFESSGQYWLINSRGKVLEYSLIRPQLPQILGADLLSPLVGTRISFRETQRAAEDALVKLLEALEQRQLLDEIEYIDCEKVYELKFGYMERYTVVVGDVEDLDLKLDMLNQVVGAIEPNLKGRIDLSATKTNDRARFIEE